jgi:hypothetical protein
MDSVAFYVIAQGPFYKNDICQINFGNTFLSLPYVLSVGIIFCHIHNNPEMEKKKTRLLRSYQSLEVVTTSERILHVLIPGSRTSLYDGPSLVLLVKNTGQNKFPNKDFLGCPAPLPPVELPDNAVAVRISILFNTKYTCSSFVYQTSSGRR